MEQHAKVLQEVRDSRSQDSDTEIKDVEAFLEENLEESKVDPSANTSQA